MGFLAPPLKVDLLTCERRVEPLGIDVARPRLAWTLRAEGNNRRQTAYQLRVGTSPGLADVWDSGKVSSDESAGVPYSGPSLASSERVFWRVKVWDESGQASAWSRSGQWTTGVLKEADWKANWIGHMGAQPESLLLRHEFEVRSGLKRAIVHVTGVGQYEMSLNGRKVGQDLLTPGWTNYRKTVHYDTYDVTKLLKPGPNAAGVLLGNGMDNVHGPRYTKFTSYLGPQQAIAQIKLVYADGQSETVGTDGNWSSHAGPITFSSVYGGEDYDLRLVQKGWDKPGFGQTWPKAAVMEGPGGTLRGVSSAAPPIQTHETFQPKLVKELRPGVEVWDLGQNASFMIRLRASGPADSAVRIIPGELLKPDGSVDRGSVGGGDCWWQLTLDGQRATYFPKFFYHGCRYLQVERIAARDGQLPKVEKLEGVVVHSSAPEVGTFSCSNELFNRTHRLIRWAQCSNLVSVITDCPHRERLGWLEQYHLNGPSLRYEHDLSTLFAKGMQDVEDSQRENGLVPDIAPEFTVFQGGFVDSPEWGSAVVLVPWQQYLFHRDVSLLERHYGAMKRYVEYLRSMSKDGIVSHGLGDWYDIGPGAPGFSKLTPIPFTATAFYYQDSVVMAQVAKMLGKTEDAELYDRTSKEIRQAFNRRFFDPAKGYYATGSQTSSAIPLVMGLIEPQHRASVLAQLVKDIQAQSVTAGDVGYRYVLRALADGGRSDVVFAMNNQSDKPGYGYQLSKGATSLTEAWDANPSSSQNHFMLGQIMEWFYHDLAGIQPVDGFKKFRIQPALVEGLDWARATYRSEYGVIESGWRREGKGVVVEVVVPPNSSAIVALPAGEKLVGSGRYTFAVGGQ